MPYHTYPGLLTDPALPPEAPPLDINFSGIGSFMFQEKDSYSRYNCKNYANLFLWVHPDPCYIEINHRIFLHDPVGYILFHFLHDGFWYEPGGNEGSRTYDCKHHGTLSKVVVVGILLSKLFHDLQGHLTWPIKLSDHLLKLLRWLHSSPLLCLAEKS